MRCRYTVPDWHRYVVASGNDTAPIFAGCRLLVKEGERTADPRSIACGYWGHQPDCAVYEEPKAPSDARSREQRVAPTADVPVGPERVWSVRAPGNPDGQRVLLMLLGGLSAVLLGWAVVLSLAALCGKPVSAGYLIVTLIGGLLSLFTHILTLLRLWVRR